MFFSAPVTQCLLTVSVCGSVSLLCRWDYRDIGCEHVPRARQPHPPQWVCRCILPGWVLEAPPYQCLQTALLGGFQHRAHREWLLLYSLQGTKTQTPLYHFITCNSFFFSPINSHCDCVSTGFPLWCQSDTQLGLGILWKSLKPTWYLEFNTFRKHCTDL